MDSNEFTDATRPLPMLYRMGAVIAERLRTVGPVYDWDAHARVVARAVLSAMREPNLTIADAMDGADYSCTEGIGLNQLGIDPGILWTAAIDAVLAETPTAVKLRLP